MIKKLIVFLFEQSGRGSIMPINMKNIIADTYAEMVTHGNVDKITVKALIEKCHISRQTFYYHFQDIIDVLEWSIQRGTEHLVEESLNAEDLRSSLRIFVTFFVDHFPQIQKLLESQKRSQIEKIAIDAVSAYLRELSQQKRPDLYYNYADREIFLRFNACGLVGILLSVSGNPRLDKEKLIRQHEEILSGELLQLETRGQVSETQSSSRL